MGLFEKLREFNKLSKSFGKVYEMIEKIEFKSVTGNISNDYLFLAYLARVEIIDRMEKYKWNPKSKIMIAEMKSVSTIEQAYYQTIHTIIKKSIEIGNSDSVSEILDKGDMFYEIQKMKD